MLERLKEAEIRFDSIEEELAKSETLSDMERYTALMKERSVLAPIIEKFREYKKAQSDAEEAIELLEMESDPDMREMANEELKRAKEDSERIYEELKILLLP